MDPFALLIEDHREVDELFDKLEGTYAKPAALESVIATREATFAALREALDTHAAIEEKVFYPALAQKAQLNDLVRGSYAEHDEVKRLLSDMAGLALDGELFALRLDELKRSVKHHVDVEENRLFPEARSLLDERTLSELGDRLSRARRQEGGKLEPDLMAGDSFDRPQPSQVTGAQLHHR